jgi:hypothetical protein
MNRTLPLFLSALLVACAGKGDDTAVGADSSADTDTDTVDDSVAPSVVSVDTVNCAEYESAGESWDLAITVDDPQGAATVTDGTVTVVSADGGDMATYMLACSNGQCFGSFRAEYDGIGCSLIGEVTLRFVVADAEGNSSQEFGYST